MPLGPKRAELALAVFALSGLALRAWFGIGAEFIYWDDDRFYLGPLSRESGLRACLALALSRAQFEAYHPLHTGLLCLERAVASSPASLHLIARGVSVALSLGLGAAWLAFGRALSWWPPATALGLALFALHPSSVEVWGDLASQKDLLGLGFFVAALWASRERARPVRTVLVPLFTLLAGASKSAYAVVGLVLLAEQLLARERPRPSSAWWAGLSAFIAVVWLVGGLLVARAHALPNPKWPSFDPWLVGSTASAYLELVFAPRDLVPVRCLASSVPRALLGLSVLAALVVLLLRGPVTDRARLWLLIALFGFLPFSNLVPTPFLVQLRYAALPTLALALGLSNLLDQRRRPALAAGFALIVVFAGLQLAAEAGPWMHRRSLWERTTEISGHCGEPTPWLNVSTARASAQDWEGAETALVEAFVQDPRREKTLRDWWLLVLLRGSCGQPPLEARHAAELARGMRLELAEAVKLPEALRPSFTFLAACRALVRGELTDPETLEGATSATRACDAERGSHFDRARPFCRSTRNNP